MRDTERAAIVAIGDELTEGRIANTNAAWLSAALWDLGVPTAAHLAVPDELDEMVGALASAAKVARWVLVSGGLGPTVDDRTREAAARFAGSPLRFHAPSFERIEAIFQSFGRAPTENNRRQAYLPEGATVLPNAMGTAPGFRLDHRGTALFFLPGVPREMRRMFEGEVVPRMQAERTDRRRVRTRRLDCFGVPESEACARLSPRLEGEPVQLAYNVSQGILQVHLRARGEDPVALEGALEKAAGIVRETFGPYRFSEGGVSLAETVLRELEARGARLAVAESCTGGLIASLLTAVPGASRVLEGAICAYSNAQKTCLLGVSSSLIAERGAVSEEVACAMAQRALSTFSVDAAVSTTGIAGPTGGTDDKPVGTVYLGCATRGPDGAVATTARRLRLRGDRAHIQRLSALSALDLLRRVLAFGSGERRSRT